MTGRRKLEAESAEQLVTLLGARGHLRDAVIQGVDLGGLEVDWREVDCTRAVFVACPMPAGKTYVDLVEGGAVVIPNLRDERPYAVYPSTLYDYGDLVGDGSDGQIEAWFERTRGSGAGPSQPVEAIAQGLHDAAMSDGIDDLLHPAEGDPRRSVGIMGGHSLKRDSDDYEAVVRLAHGLTRAGYFVVTGGGPGVMEAGNLGAYLTRADGGEAIADAIEVLKDAPSVEHPGYDQAAERVHASLADSTGGESLAVPTWLYGHEPVSRFATHIAKYFANSIREDGLLRIAGEGIVFARGGPGTIQEVFQDAAINAYAPEGSRAPMVFLGREFFTANGVYEVTRRQAAGASPPHDDLLTLTDDVDEAIGFIAARLAP